MISDFLRSIARCPACALSGNGSAGALASAPKGLRCPHCGRVFPPIGEEGYLDLRPPEGAFPDLTEYAEEEFHHRPGGMRPLFLSAKVKMDMMSKMLRLTPADRVLDIGCGDGRFVFFSRPSCGELVGIDAGAHFASETIDSVDLARGDVRVLPFQDAAFDKAYSLDVLEHLTEEGVYRMLSEARRVLRPKGRLFLYSHVMQSSRLAVFQRSVNRLVRFLDARGLVDNAPERERKSDHRNALASYEELDRLLKRTGFEVESIRYYNVFFKAVIEDLMLPLMEHNFYRRKGKKRSSEADSHSHRSSRPDVGPWAHLPLSLASQLMKLDVLLFGRVRTGPFFLLLRAA